MDGGEAAWPFLLACEPPGETSGSWQAQNFAFDAETMVRTRCVARVHVYGSAITASRAEARDPDSWARVSRPPLPRRCCRCLPPEWSACRRPRVTTQHLRAQTVVQKWDPSARGGEPRSASADPRSAEFQAALSRWLLTRTPTAFAVSPQHLALLLPRPAP